MPGSGTLSARYQTIGINVCRLCGRLIILLIPHLAHLTHHLTGRAADKDEIWIRLSKGKAKILSMNWLNVTNLTILEYKMRCSLFIYLIPPTVEYKALLEVET